ncbi:MAG TPA: transcriptional repressor LexA [Candidatus Hydrogenedentes bacterium]|nr:transcriptional repressor LexA [Candidatus Hydrogenedentota bacterium]HPG69933.1 transcriptional repressor LexA [Candidatus Hydrogenedentota bacterium]
MAKELTKRQAAILQFIIESIRDHGYPPTIAEIGDAFDIRSTNGVNDHLVALERKGYIERLPKARGIHVTERAAAGIYENRVGALPLVGRVAAGQPILAEENIEDYVAVSVSLARRHAYCLRVRGDSMIEDGIFDGDVIVVDQDREAHKGDIVVALVEDEVTVKRFFPHGNRIELRPANAAMSPMIFPANDVRLQGVVVALQRTIA